MEMSYPHVCLIGHVSISYLLCNISSMQQLACHCSICDLKGPRWQQMLLSDSVSCFLKKYALYDIFYVWETVAYTTYTCGDLYVISFSLTFTDFIYTVHTFFLSLWRVRNSMWNFFYYASKVSFPHCLIQIKKI